MFQDLASRVRRRALLLERARLFFKERGIIEVDCPLMGKAAPIDLHIDLFTVYNKKKERYYLHSSPEYFMKRLLAEASLDIYQLAHVFRDEDKSERHAIEFMMAEWYRLNFSLDEMIKETLEFIALFVPISASHIFTYREAFQTFAGIDYVTATDQALFDLLHTRGIIPYDGIMEEGTDALLNLILGTIIEPAFKTLGTVVLKEYPLSQAALSQKKEKEGEIVGERFEIYYNGIELANGYKELQDPKEQLFRLEKSNRERVRHHKEALPIDYDFLRALEKGLPDLSGVAVGFDRLLLLEANGSSLDDVLPIQA
jgi:lysyl-tRNA synthetase class 2